jgi:hypothetical protein
MTGMIAQYASFGVQVEITEYDFIEPNSAIDMSLASTFSHNLLQACVSAPNCTPFNNWGFSQIFGS